MQFSLDVKMKSFSLTSNPRWEAFEPEIDAYILNTQSVICFILASILNYKPCHVLVIQSRSDHIAFIISNLIDVLCLHCTRT